jgi:hypothetical protein
LKESNHAENPLDSSACVFAHGWKKLERALELLLLEDPRKTNQQVATRLAYEAKRRLQKKFHVDM